MSLQSDLYYFFKISRAGNLLTIFLSICLGAWLATDRHFLFFTHSIFWAVAIATVLIAAGGYWINDVYDFKIDRVNKPHRALISTFLSVKKVLTAYIVMNVAVLILAFPFIHRLSFILLGAILLLYIYAAWLKRISLVGNVVVAFLTALVLMMAGFIYNFNNPLIWAAIFSFEVNLIREMVKDIEDVKGDHQFGLHTLPIQLGIRSTKQVITTIYILFFTTCWVPVFLHFHRHAEILWEYVSASLLLVQLPILFLIFHLQRAYVIPADFAVHSRYVKILIFLGMVSILFLR